MIRYSCFALILSASIASADPRTHKEETPLPGAKAPRAKVSDQPPLFRQLVKTSGGGSGNGVGDCFVHESQLYWLNGDGIGQRRLGALRDNKTQSPNYTLPLYAEGMAFAPKAEEIFVWGVDQHWNAKPKKEQNFLQRGIAVLKGANKEEENYRTEPDITEMKMSLVRPGGGPSAPAFPADSEIMKAVGASKLLRGAVTPDAKYFLLGASHAAAHVFLVDRTGKILARYPNGEYPARQDPMTFSPDGRRYAIFTGTKLLVFETATQKQIQSLPAAGDAPSHCAFSPDGKTIATLGNASGAARIWNVATGKLEYRSAKAADPLAAPVPVRAKDPHAYRNWGRMHGPHWELPRGEFESGGIRFSDDGRTVFWSEMDPNGKTGDLSVLPWDGPGGVTPIPARVRPSATGAFTCIAPHEKGALLGAADGGLTWLDFPAITRRDPSMRFQTLWNNLLYTDADGAEAEAALKKEWEVHGSKVQALLPTVLTNAQVKQHLAELDDETFATRENAQKQLARGMSVEDLSEIHSIAATSPSAQQRAEAIRIIKSIEGQRAAEETRRFRLRRIASKELLAELDKSSLWRAP